MLKLPWLLLQSTPVGAWRMPAGTMEACNSGKLRKMGISSSLYRLLGQEAAGWRIRPLRRIGIMSIRLSSSNSNTVTMHMLRRAGQPP